MCFKNFSHYPSPDLETRSLTYLYNLMHSTVKPKKGTKCVRICVLPITGNCQWQGRGCGVVSGAVFSAQAGPHAQASFGLVTDILLSPQPLGSCWSRGAPGQLSWNREPESLHLWPSDLFLSRVMRFPAMKYSLKYNFIYMDVLIIKQ